MKLSEELLYEILTQEDVWPAPTEIKLYGDWLEITVEIGDDHTARILLSQEDWEVLCDRNAQTL